MRADPERRRGLCRRPRPLRRAARPLGAGPAADRPAAAAGACQPLGLPHAARRRAGAGAPAPAAGAARRARRGQGYLDRWGDFIVGLSYLWEGQVLLAEKLLRPTLARAEGDLGRRNPFTCMLAALLAAALWERNEPDEAGALLANRLDVLERSAPARGGAAGLSHDGAHRRGRRRRAPRARAAGRAGRGRRGAPAAAPAHRQPGRPGAPARAALPRRDLPRPVRADRRAAGRAGARRRAGCGGAACCCCARWRWPCGDRRAGLAPRRRGAGARRRAWRRASSSAACTSSCWACAPGRSTAAARSRCRCCARRPTWPPTYGLLRVFDDAHPALGDWVRQALPAAAPRRPGPARWPRRCGRRRRAGAPRGARQPQHGAHAQGARGAGAGWRATSPTRRSAWRCRSAKRPSSGT